MKNMIIFDVEVAEVITKSGKEAIAEAITAVARYGGIQPPIIPITLPAIPPKIIDYMEAYGEFEKSHAEEARLEDYDNKLL